MTPWTTYQVASHHSTQTCVIHIWSARSKEIRIWISFSICAQFCWHPNLRYPTSDCFSRVLSWMVCGSWSCCFSCLRCVGHLSYSWIWIWLLFWLEIDSKSAPASLGLGCECQFFWPEITTDIILSPAFRWTLEKNTHLIYRYHTVSPFLFLIISCFVFVQNYQCHAELSLICQVVQLKYAGATLENMSTSVEAECLFLLFHVPRRDCVSVLLEALSRRTRCQD